MAKLIPYRDFAKLRFSQFCIGDMGDGIEELTDWEVMEHRWVGEAINFTQFLRLQSHPNTLRSIAIDLSVHPQKVWNAILDKIGLPIRSGMSLAAVKKVLALTNAKVSRLPKTAMKFTLGEEEKYDVKCVFDRDGGLAYVVVMRSDYRSRKR